MHLGAYLDDFSRFVVGFGLHASASGALVREVFEQAIANFGAPEGILCDNGAQYHTWRGKSAFARLCERRGIRQIVASPRRPQTLGKIERFWGTLWRELVEGAVFQDLEEARTRIGLFLGYYEWATQCYSASCRCGERDYVLAGLRPRTSDARSKGSRGLLKRGLIQIAHLDDPRQPVAQVLGGEKSMSHEGARLSRTGAQALGGALERDDLRRSLRIEDGDAVLVA